MKNVSKEVTPRKLKCEKYRLLGKKSAFFCVQDVEGILGREHWFTPKQQFKIGSSVETLDAYVKENTFICSTEMETVVVKQPCNFSLIILHIHKVRIWAFVPTVLSQLKKLF